MAIRNGNSEMANRNWQFGNGKSEMENQKMANQKQQKNGKSLKANNDQKL